MPTLYRCIVSKEELPFTDVVATEHGYIAKYLWAGVPAELSESGQAEVPDYLKRVIQARRNAGEWNSEGHVRCALSGEVLDIGQTYPTRIGPVGKHLWGPVAPQQQGGSYQLPEHLERLSRSVSAA